jgi:hypothetical protein
VQSEQEVIAVEQDFAGDFKNLQALESSYNESNVQGKNDYRLFIPK